MSKLNREWITLGDTSIDLSTILKVAFGKDARLYALAGDALALCAWTQDRTQVAMLRKLASQDKGWVNVAAEHPQETDETEGDGPEDTALALDDERVCLTFVDRAVESTAEDQRMLTLFSGGVFIGEIYGDDILLAKDILGI